MKRSLYLILAALAATPAGAATLAETVDLRTVLRFARDASIPVLVEQSNVQVAIAERSEARALPNPTLSYNRQHQPGRLTNFDSDRAQDWTFEQPLLLGGQRKARMQAASAAIDAASARVTLTRHAVAADVASAYVELLLAQERVAALKAGLDELTGLRDVVEGRRAGGLASDYDVLRVDVEESSWRAGGGSRIDTGRKADRTGIDARRRQLAPARQWQTRTTGIAGTGCVDPASGHRSCAARRVRGSRARECRQA